MTSFADEVRHSRRELWEDDGAERHTKSADEGGCGVLGFSSSVKIRGHHMFRPAMQMHNRGNGKGGGIAAAGLDATYLGVSQEVLDECYLLQIALLDPTALDELEEKHIRPVFEVAHEQMLPTQEDHQSLGLEVRPPDVKRYFVRPKRGVLDAFEASFETASGRDLEDEFVWQNSFRINQQYYASLGEQRAFVLSHGRDLMILKIVGYAENVIKFYGLEDMPAHVWIAHQRYPTRGRVWHPAGAHPFIGMNEALVHNGDFANYHSVAEYLKQRGMVPQFLTDTEVSVMTFDLWSRIYKYPLEYVIEGLAPTTELDFDRLPKEKQEVYRAIQATHVHGSPDGPWFFIIARSQPDQRQCQLVGITDTSMLRPQVFALSEGDVQIGLCASEKQAIDAVLESISEEDGRFRPIADKYWNARGGSHTDGGSFVFTVERHGSGAELTCTDKFGEAVTADRGREACDFTEDPRGAASAEQDAALGARLSEGRSRELSAEIAALMPECDYKKLRWAIHRIVAHGCNGSTAAALDTLTLLNDRRYPIGGKKRSSVLQIVRSAIVSLLDRCPGLENGAGKPSPFRRVCWETRDALRGPREGETILVVDAAGFEPEGDDCDAWLQVKAQELGWETFVVYNLRGQRFHACGFGPASKGTTVHLYGSSGDYAGSGMDGCELHIHGDAQDQLGQILKDGKLVVYGSVGQTFMYGSKGGAVYVMESAAGRPLINAVGKPRVIINGTCLDFLAESFMAGDALNGGGYVVVNGITYDDDGCLADLPTPYPGSNLFSLASGGALYIRDPGQTVVEEQLNGGSLVALTEADWELLLPYLEENEALFGIRVEDLLTIDGQRLPPEQVYRKVMPISAQALAKELPEDDRYRDT